MLSTFADIFDQPSAVETLRRAYAAERMPHAMIFAGPVGVGKGATASALTALWLCERPSGARPCGRCASCVAMAAGSHPDEHIVTKELIRYHDKTGKSKGVDLSINVIRPEVVAKAAMKPVMGRGKVFVIEQAEVMNAPAQNALLKTLEEPAGRTLIILLTAAPGWLLPTIRSRCQTITFASLPQATVRRELGRRGVEASLAAEAARLAGGSLGEALRWVEDGVIEPVRAWVGRLDDWLASRQPGADEAAIPDWFKAAAEQYAEKQMQRDELGSKDQASRQGLVLYLRLGAEHLRQQLAVPESGEAQERICGAIDGLRKAEEYLDANVSVPLLLQELAVSLGG